jgi:hypothetical protein
MLHETEKLVPTAVLVGFTLKNKRDAVSKLDDPLDELRQLGKFRVRFSRAT